MKLNKKNLAKRKKRAKLYHYVYGGYDRYFWAYRSKPYSTLYSVFFYSCSVIGTVALSIFLYITRQTIVPISDTPSVVDRLNLVEDLDQYLTYLQTEKGIALCIYTDDFFDMSYDDICTGTSSILLFFDGSTSDIYVGDSCFYTDADIDVFNDTFILSLRAGKSFDTAVKLASKTLPRYSNSDWILLLVLIAIKDIILVVYKVREIIYEYRSPEVRAYLKATVVNEPDIEICPYCLSRIVDDACICCGR